MKLIKQTLFSMSYWCFILGLALMWNPQTIQAEASIDYDESMETDGRITCFQLNKQDGSALISLQNGATFCEADFPRDIRIRTCQTGSHESLIFNITDPSGVSWSNTENTVPYDSKQFWATPGTWTIRARLFSHANGTGTKFDDETISFTVEDCTATCNGRVTCFQLNKQDGSALVSLQDGASFCESDFSRDIRIRTCESGSHESLRFTISGPSGTWTNVENAVPYDSKQFWPAPGTWTITTQLFQDNDASGNLCDESSISINIEDCSAPMLDCPTLNANIGDACNDRNANTTNDQVQSDCTCAGTPVAPTVDCPALNANIGDACNDGNGNTSNDQVQSDCTCAGTANPTSGCTAMISSSGRTITISNLQGAIKSVKFLSSSFATLQSCDTWGGTLCGNTESFTVPTCGTYFVQVQTYADWSTPVCNILETVNITDCGGGGTPTVDCPALNANIGDACNDGNSNTTNDRVQGNCTCSGTPVVPTVDCPALNANIGDACNDGNANTTNDRVQSDCSCAGMSSGSNTCNATFTVSGNKIIIEGLDAGINSAKILSNNYSVEAACADWESGCNGMLMATVTPGTYFVQVQTYADWSTPLCNIFEEVTVGGGSAPTVDCPALNANIGDACNDGNGNTTNDIVQANCTCAGTPVAPTVDCPALNANIGDACNDGNGNTTNDRVQSDCSCAGTPVQTQGCNPAEIAYWSLDNCRSFGNDGSDRDFSELSAVTTRNGFSSVNASILNHDDGDHSCLQGVSGSAICSGIRTDCTFSANSGDAFRFTVNVTPTNGSTGNLTGLSFYEMAPSSFVHLSGNSGDNDPPSLYGIRVLKNGNEIFRSTNNNTTQRWTLEQFDFSSEGDFSFTGATQFEFELLGYCRQGSGGLALWDLDEIRVFGCMDAAAPTVDCSNLNANIGDACNDGDPNTNDDTVQSNCTCAGTPTGGNGGGCNLVITAGSDFIQVSGVVGAFPTVGILDDSGNQIFSCHTFNGGCPTTVRVDGLAPGTYWVNANVIDSDWVTVLCDAFEDPVVGGQGRESNGTINPVQEKQSITINEVAHDFTLFPNPANEKVNVSLMGYEGKDVTIQMIDYTGKPVKSVAIDNVSDTNVAIPIDRFSNGIYTVRIISAGMKPVGKKMIVNKRF